MAFVPSARGEQGQQVSGHDLMLGLADFFADQIAEMIRRIEQAEAEAAKPDQAIRQRRARPRKVRDRIRDFPCRFA